MRLQRGKQKHLKPILYSPSKRSNTMSSLTEFACAKRILFCHMYTTVQKEDAGCKITFTRRSVCIHCTVIARKVIFTSTSRKLCSVYVAYMARGQVKDEDTTSFDTICSSWKPKSSRQDKSATAVATAGGSKGHTNADFIVISGYGGCSRADMTTVKRNCICMYHSHILCTKN